jgi:hypothetical protein
MKVDLIHKPGCGNVVPDVPSNQEEVKAMNTIKILWVLFISERTL